METLASKAKSIFLHAADLSDADRSGYLDEECGADASLRREVEALLGHHEPGGDFLEPPAAAVTHIGPYKLLEQIGEGGMGLVYMAEQTHPVRRKVALKVIKPGLDSRQVIARFEAERQALAMMDHPNIARVFDAGPSGDGRPYFVMELVRGIPVTEYCEQKLLAVRERLELFEAVCRAVQHAHQKGVIHRDLKPSNVLVTLLDGSPMPKVIDFGVAKALGQNLTDRTLFTNFTQVIGTPLYMSPEQAGMSALDVDTRSDIYSLGVLLYELLTGTTPIDRDRLQLADIDEMRRLIREEEPVKPSTRVSTLAASETQAAGAVPGEPRRLSRLFRGELDWIVMKCLEKDRNRRYETAAGLAADVRRYLNGEPVLAAPPAAGYRVRKFVRRNKAVVTAAGLIAASLIAGIAGTTWQAITAERARRQADARLAHAVRSNEILGSVFADLDPKADEKEGVHLRVILGRKLEQAAAQLDGESIGDPLAVADMQVRLGLAQLGLGYPKKAAELFEKARDTRTEHLGPTHRDTLATLNKLGQAYYQSARVAEALAVFEQVCQANRAKLGTTHADSLAAANNLAGAYLAVNRLGDAVQLLEEVAAGWRETAGPDDVRTLETQSNLARAYHFVGRLPESIRLAEQVAEVRARAVGPDHAATLTTLTNLAGAYRDAGRLDDAIRVYESVRAAQLPKLGPQHAAYLAICTNLSLTYRYIGRLDEAGALLEQVRQAQVTARGADDPATLATRRELAAVHLDAGRTAEAVRLLEEVRKAQATRPGPNDPSSWATLHYLGMAYREAGRLPEAIQVLEKLRAGRVARLKAEHPDTLDTTVQLVLTYLAAGRFADAEAAARDLLHIRRAKKSDEWTTFAAMSHLGASLAGQSKFAEAEPHLRDGYAGLAERRAAIPGGDRTKQLTAARDRLAACYEAWGKPDEAAKWRGAEPKSTLPADRLVDDRPGQ